MVTINQRNLDFGTVDIINKTLTSHKYERTFGESWLTEIVKHSFFHLPLFYLTFSEFGIDCPIRPALLFKTVSMRPDDCPFCNCVCVLLSVDCDNYL